MTERDAFELRFAGRRPRLRRTHLVRPRPGRARPPDRSRAAAPARAGGVARVARCRSPTRRLGPAPGRGPDRRAGRHGARRVAPARDRAPRPSPRRGAGPDRHRRPDPRDRGVRTGGRGRRRHPLGARAGWAARAVRSRERIGGGLDDRRRRGIRVTASSGFDILPAREGGVWLVGQRTLRLFDGEVFGQVIDAPADIGIAAEAPDGSLWATTGPWPTRGGRSRDALGRIVMEQPRPRRAEGGRHRRGARRGRGRPALDRLGAGRRLYLRRPDPPCTRAGSRATTGSPGRPSTRRTRQRSAAESSRSSNCPTGMSGWPPRPGSPVSTVPPGPTPRGRGAPGGHRWPPRRTGRSGSLRSTAARRSASRGSTGGRGSPMDTQTACRARTRAAPM